jgi:hypothetical protein
MAERITRRQALKGTAAALASISIVPSLAAGQSAPRRGRSIPRVGIIGSGGKGWSGMEWAA